MKKNLNVVLFSLLIPGLVGCSSFGRKLKSFLGGDEAKPKAAVARTAPVGAQGPVRFSDRPDLKFNTARKYRRMTKGRFEDQAKVKDASGSLWVMDGQGAYLFSQNQVRKIGDLLNVKLEGAAKEQLETKVKVIKRLLKKLESERTFRKLAAAKRKKTQGASADKKEENKQSRAPASAGKTQLEEELKVSEVPTRIVEKLPDGNYRVKGHQAFMIGKKEYKVIVTGVVRNEDFNEDGIVSGKILDPRYDIVSQRRSFVE